MQRKKLFQLLQMLRKKRNIRKQKRQLKKVGGIVLAVGALFLVVGGMVVYALFFQKVSYLSPLSTKVSAEVGVRQDNELATLKKNLAEKQIEINAITASGSGYLVILKNDSSVTFSSQKDINVQISSLQFILSRLTMEGRRFSRLDLSFDKPIIVLE